MLNNLRAEHLLEIIFVLDGGHLVRILTLLLLLIRILLAEERHLVRMHEAVRTEIF